MNEPQAEIVPDRFLGIAWTADGRCGPVCPGDLSAEECVEVATMLLLAAERQQERELQEARHNRRAA
jgi:hypothetical protein